MIREVVFDFNGVILNKHTQQIDTDMLELLAQLYELEVDIDLFSNTSKQAIVFLDSKYRFLKFFKNIILTEETGLSKPSDEAFKNLLETLKAEPSDIVYIDDNRNNIRQADKFGMKAVHFINEAKLRVKLIEIAENDN